MPVPNPVSRARRATVLAVALLGACRAYPAPPEPPAVVDAVAVTAEAGGPAELAEPATMRPPRALDADGAFYVLEEDPLHPRVRYLDGQLSLNASCAIRTGNKLGRAIPPVYVNGRPIGFC